MAVVQGNPALASDYNTLRGEVNRWFADNYPGLAFGNSNQTYGWGGSAAAAVVTGNSMTAAQMNSLVDRCDLGTDVVNNVSGALSQVVATNLITAAEFNNIESKSDLITTNRNDIEAAELSLHAGGNSATSAVWTTSRDCTFRYTFTELKPARYFFNSGGAFNISATITGYSTGAGWDGEGFNDVFTNMGTVTMDYTQTVQSGSLGSPTAYGYYDLPSAGTWQLIFSQQGPGVYYLCDLYIYARQVNSGGSGPAYVELRVLLTHTAPYADINGTITITTQYRKLDNQSSGGASLTITAPTYSLTDPL